MMSGDGRLGELSSMLDGRLLIKTLVAGIDLIEPRS